MLFAAIASFLTAWLPGRFFAWLGQDSHLAFLLNGATLAVIFAAAVLITYFSTWERAETAINSKEKPKQSDDRLPTGTSLKNISSVFRVKSFNQHLLIYLFSFTARDIVGAVYVFFVIYAMQSNQVQASNILTFGTLVGIPCNFIWPIVISKFGPSRMLRTMYMIMALTIIGYGFRLFDASSNMRH